MKEPTDTLPLDATASQAQLNASGDANPTVVAEQKHAGAAVKAALIANIGVAIAKLAAAVFTGSSSMLSESVHSIADCSNEIVLIIGDKVSKHKLNSEHPFGWYRTKYLASFVVATLLFFVGGFFSTPEAMKKIIAVNDDPALQNANRMELVVALVVVVISACLEWYGLHQSIKEANERMKRTDTPKMGIFRFWKRTKSAELASVIMEDTLALIGLAFAFIGIGCAIIFDNELFDAIGGRSPAGRRLTRPGLQVRVAAHRRIGDPGHPRTHRAGGRTDRRRGEADQHADRAHVGRQHPAVSQSADVQARP